MDIFATLIVAMICSIFVERELAMTQAERNAAISRKIVAYTARFASSRVIANETLKREGFNVAPVARSKKRQVAATEG